MTGVPPGLQNQCRALGASWVGSIPTCSRQKNILVLLKKWQKQLIDNTYKLTRISKRSGIDSF